MSAFINIVQIGQLALRNQHAFLLTFFLLQSSLQYNIAQKITQAFFCTFSKIPGNSSCIRLYLSLSGVKSGHLQIPLRKRYSGLETPQTNPFRYPLQALPYPG